MNPRHTRPRSLRPPPALWTAAQAEAHADGRTMTDLVVSLLSDWLSTRRAQRHRESLERTRRGERPCGATFAGGDPDQACAECHFPVGVHGGWVPEAARHACDRSLFAKPGPWILCDHCGHRFDAHAAWPL